MKLSTLEYFLVLAESQSINQAAQKLYITQPCLTRAIQSFEKEIGVQLFYRAKSGIRLTEAGEKILPEVRDVVKYWQSWKDLSRKDTLRRIDIYSQSIFSNFLLPDVLFQFKKKYPETSINLTSVLRPKRYLSRDIHAPVLALTVCSQEMMAEAAELQGNPPAVLFQGEYQCVVNTGSPLARQESVSFEELREYFFVFTHTKGLTDGNHTFSQMFQHLFNQISPPRIIEVESIPNMISLLGRNTEAFCLAYYPMLTQWQAVAQGKLVSIPIQGQRTQGAACLFYAEQAYRIHPALRELVRDIKDASQLLVEEAQPRSISG